MLILESTTRKLLFALSCPSACPTQKTTLGTTKFISILLLVSLGPGFHPRRVISKAKCRPEPWCYLLASTRYTDRITIANHEGGHSVKKDYTQLIDCGLYPFRFECIHIQYLSCASTDILISNSVFLSRLLKQECKRHVS